MELQEDALATGKASPLPACLSLLLRGFVHLSQGLEQVVFQKSGCRIITILAIVLTVYKEEIQAFIRPLGEWLVESLGGEEGGWRGGGGGLGGRELDDSEIPELEDLEVIAQEAATAAAFQRGAEQQVQKKKGQQRRKRKKRRQRCQTIEEEEGEGEREGEEEAEDGRRKTTRIRHGRSRLEGNVEKDEDACNEDGHQQQQQYPIRSKRQSQNKSYANDSSSSSSSSSSSISSRYDNIPIVVASKRVPPAGWLVYDKVLGLVTYEELQEYQQRQQRQQQEQGQEIKGGGGKGKDNGNHGGIVADAAGRQQQINGGGNGHLQGPALRSSTKKQRQMRQKQQQS